MDVVGCDFFITDYNHSYTLQCYHKTLAAQAAGLQVNITLVRLSVGMSR